MKTPHRNSALIHAWADGENIQYFSGAVWHTIYGEPSWGSSTPMRVEPYRWQKEIDAQKEGKSVQCRTRGDGRWFDSVFSAHDFTEPNSEFRIKPSVYRYRVCAMKNEFRAFTTTADSCDEEESLSGSPIFAGWIGDWQEAEIPG